MRVDPIRGQQVHQAGRGDLVTLLQFVLLAGAPVVGVLAVKVVQDFRRMS